MKRNILTVAALLSFVCFAGCGSASRTETSDAQTAPAAQTETEGQTESAESQTAAEPKTEPVAEAASSETLTEAAVRDSGRRALFRRGPELQRQEQPFH